MKAETFDEIVKFFAFLIAIGFGIMIYLLYSITSSWWTIATICPD